MTTPTPREATPERIGPFRVVADLPPSTAGRCHLALRDGGDPIELVVPHPALAADPAFRERFAAAVRAARELGHPALATVVAADPDAELPWLALNWVPATTVDHAVRETGPLPAGTVRTTASGVAGALAAWHTTGLVHGGVEPALVRLTRSGPVLHGAVAAAARPAPGLDGVAARSPGYLSPEQADGHDPGPASDVFSLASVVAFAATGRAPFGDDDGSAAGSTALGVLRRIRSLRSDEPQRILDDPVRLVVEESMRREPGARPDVAVARDRYAGGQPAVPLPAELAALLPAPPFGGAPPSPPPGSPAGATSTAPPTPGGPPAATYPGPGIPGSTQPAAGYPGPRHPAPADAGPPGGPYPGTAPAHPGSPGPFPAQAPGPFAPGAPVPGTPHPGADQTGGYPPGPPGPGGPPYPGGPFPSGAGGADRPGRRFARRAVLGGAAALVVAGAVGGGLWAARGAAAPAQLWTLPGPGGDDAGSRIAGVGGLAVVVSAGPTLRAFDVRTGQPRWEYSLNGIVGDVLTGPASVFVDDGSTICIDASTGRQRWDVPFGSLRAVVGSIVVADRTTELSADTPLEMVGLRVADGTLVWRIPLETSPNSSPIASGDGRVHVVLDEELVTVDTGAGRVLWRQPTAGTLSDLRLCAGALLVTRSRSADVVALDAATGAPLWTMPGRPGGTLAPDLGTDGTTLVASGIVELVGVDPRNGTRTWTRDLSENREFRSVSGSPLVAADLVLGSGSYTRSGDDEAQNVPTLHAFDPRDGSDVWSLPLPRRITPDYGASRGGPVLIDRTLMLSTEDGALFAFGPLG